MLASFWWTIRKSAPRGGECRAPPWLRTARRSPSRSAVPRQGTRLRLLQWGRCLDLFLGLRRRVRSPRQHPVLVWDYRAHGASGLSPNLDRLTMADVADDLARVMDAAGIDRAGHHLGALDGLPGNPRVLPPVSGANDGFGAHPRRLSARPANTFLDPRVGPAIFKTAYAIGTRIPKLRGHRSSRRPAPTAHLADDPAIGFGLHPDLARKQDIDPYLDHMARLDPRVFPRVRARGPRSRRRAACSQTSKCPPSSWPANATCLHPRHLSVEMAGRFPRAELLEIPRGSHAALIEQPELINLRLEKFIRDSVEPFEARRAADANPPTGSAASVGRISNGHHKSRDTEL